MLRRGCRRSAGLVVSASLVALAGACCRKPPGSVVEVNLALSRAKEACAAVYAPQELAVVERRVEAMNRLADEGKCRTAASAADPLKPDVVAFSSLVEARKDRARSEAERALAEANAALAGVRGARPGPQPGALEGTERALATARRMGEDPCAYLRAAALAREAAESAARTGAAAREGGGVEAPRR